MGRILAWRGPGPETFGRTSLRLQGVIRQGLGAQ